MWRTTMLKQPEFRGDTGLTGNRSKYFALRRTATGRLGKRKKRISIEFH
jgi:hypothetical protein